MKSRQIREHVKKKLYAGEKRSVIFQQLITRGVAGRKSAFFVATTAVTIHPRAIDDGLR